MRPVELVMQGFGPFRDRVTIDFADADDVCLGPAANSQVRLDVGRVATV